VGAVVEVTSARKKRIAAFIEPLRVEPGSDVELSRDFDPKFRSDVVRKQVGRELPQTGIALLAEYQTKLAAEQTHGVPVCLQSLDAVHPARATTPLGDAGMVSGVGLVGANTAIHPHGATAGAGWRLSSEGEESKDGHRRRARPDRLPADRVPRRPPHR
jgi:hypothetical protein